MEVLKVLSIGMDQNQKVTDDGFSISHDFQQFSLELLLPVISSVELVKQMFVHDDVFYKLVGKPDIFGQILGDLTDFSLVVV